MDAGAVLVQLGDDAVDGDVLNGEVMRYAMRVTLGNGTVTAPLRPMVVHDAIFLPRHFATKLALIGIGMPCICAS
jgi:hypothetical protein